MAIDQLKTFLVERLLDLDPTLNDQSGSMMYVKVIDPLIKRLGTDPYKVDIETFIISRLQDEYPQFDVQSPGSIIRDVLVSPLALILEPLQREIEFLRTQKSLSDVVTLTEAEMDALLSNVLSERQWGDYARGTVRVYFNNARSVGVDASITFSTAKGETFAAEEAYTYAPNEMVRSGGKYYIDIPVRSQQPNASMNIAAGAIRYQTGLDGVSRVTNLSAMTGGVTKETNEEFLVRAARSLSERSLNTKRGIETEILNSYEEIVSVSVVGHGEPDMQRDILQARVKPEYDENLGPLVYMTANWKSHPIFGGSCILPFTNVLKLMPPASDAGGGVAGDGDWPDALKTALLSAKYIRLADGSGLTWSHNDNLNPIPSKGGAPNWGDDVGQAGANHWFRDNTYNDALLNRVRAVESAYLNPGSDYAIYLKLKDFDIYPEPVDILGEVPAIGTLHTSDPEMGLNRRSAQGSMFKMIGEKEGSDIVLGAHLPFTDHVKTNFVPEDIPGSVVPGRDFLITWTEDSTFNQTDAAQPLGLTLPEKLQMWPLTRFYSSTELGVGRVDSFLVSKNRTVYPGKLEYKFDPNLVFSMMRERPRLYDYGTPYYTQDSQDPSAVYGGKEKEEVGRNPGCSLQVMNDLPSIIPESSSWNVLSHPAEVDLILHHTQPKWADRGVTAGQHVACTVFRESFDGKLQNVDDDMLWQGWGRVKKVGAGTPWRTRVEGLDFGPLHEYNFAQFSPGASAVIEATDVPQIPDFDVVTNPNRESTVMEVWIDGTMWQQDIDLKHSWNGGAGLASKTFTVDSALLTESAPGDYPGGIMKIVCPLADPANPNVVGGFVEVDDSASIYNGGNYVGDWAAGLKAEWDAMNAAINGFEVDMQVQVVGLEVQFTITSKLWGKYGEMIAVDNDGFFCKQNAQGLPPGGNLENGTAPEMHHLIQELIDVVNGKPGYPATDFDGNPLTNYGGPTDWAAEPLGPLADGKFRVYSTVPGSQNNGTSYYFAHRDYATPAAPFTNGTWNQAMPVIPPYAAQVGNKSGELEGGFNYGFGPIVQVGCDQAVDNPATDPVLLAGNVYPEVYDEAADLDLFGHEILETVPVIDGMEARFTLTMANTPIQRGSARLHYWDINKDPDNAGTWYIFDDTGDGRLTQVWPTPIDAMAAAVGAANLQDAVNLALELEEVNGLWVEKAEIEYSQGLITLEFNANEIPQVGGSNQALNANDPNRESPAFTIGYNYYLNPFKVCWSVYRNKVETISPSGDLGVSYDDFAYVPAYKRPGMYGTDTLSTTTGHVVARGNSNYRGSRWDPDTGDNHATTYRWSENDGEVNKRRALWLRLGKGFTEAHRSLGAPASAACISGEAISMDAQGKGHAHVWPTGQYDSADQMSYAKARYTLTGSTLAGTALDLDGDGTLDDYILTRCSLPVVPGATKLKNPQDPTVTEFDLDEMSYINYTGSSGFLVPHPSGPAHYGGVEFPYANPISTNRLLNNQIVQVYAQAADDTEDSGIVVSGIPGSTPFPDWFGGDFEIKANEVHIGGMTDVYIKATSVAEQTTAPILLQPEAIDPDALPAPTPQDPPPSHEVLVSASDGGIDAVTDPTHFDSGDLLAAIVQHYDPAPGTDISLDNLVIEILDPPSGDLQPRFFRAIHTQSSSPNGGVRIDGKFPDGAAYANLRFRALFGCTTSINKPLVVHQQGNDLVVQKNDFSVFCPSGFNFGTSPSDTSLYISIDSNTSRGEYRIIGKNLNTLVLEESIPETGSGLSYRVYSKQAAGVELPLVRLKAVSLSGGDTEGVSVPYKNPVDIISSSFAGMNDDPINEESIGEDPIGTWEPTILIGADENGNAANPKAHLVVHEGEDFVTEWNVLKYDVVRIDTLEDPDKYFYVEGFTHTDTNNAAGGTSLNTLILDRPIEGLLSSIENIRFTLGRPAIGSAEIVFRDPTYFEAGPDTIFSYKSVADKKTYQFRPSPLESALLYSTDYASSDLTINPATPGVIISEDENFFKHGISVGDRLVIKTRQFRSNLFNGQDPFLEDENLTLAGKVLTILIDGERRSVSFSGPNPTTLEQAVADINRQVGDSLKASIWEDPTNAEHYYLQIASSKAVQLLNEGTIGVLEELRCQTLDHQDNNFYPAGWELFDPYTVTAVTYVDSASTGTGNAQWRISVVNSDGQPTPVAGDPEVVFVDVLREKYQRVYPTDMVPNEYGLYSAKITLTSYDPNVKDGLVDDQQQLDVINHKSLGYEVVVKNSNYSYSLGEESSIRTTAIALSDTSGDLKDVYALPGAEVTLTYERSQPVQDVQSLLLSRDLRVVCNNPLSRHYFPAYPLAGLSYGDTSLGNSEVFGLLEDFFKTLYPNKPLELYDVAALLARKGVGYVEFPQKVAFLTHDENRVVRIVRDENIIYLNKRFHIMEDLAGIILNKAR